jgi:hypothetical protein
MDDLVCCVIPVDIDVRHHVFLLLLLQHRKGRLCIVNLSHQLHPLTYLLKVALTGSLA